MNRQEVYAKISEKIGYTFHTGELKTIESAREVWLIIKAIAAEQAAISTGQGK